ncbi:MAG: tetratricopeptide repeat protein, partial [Verrucomicrobiota bacterium]
FRGRLLGEGLTPIEELSSAFRNVETGEDLMFAYYQSSLVVEFLMETVGIPGMRRILQGLAVGMRVEKAMGEVVGKWREIEEHFVEYARGEAEAYGGLADWEEPLFQPETMEEVEAYVREHPASLWGIQSLHQRYVEAGKWDDAMNAARSLISLFPDDVEEGCGYQRLAFAAREGGDEETERWAMQEWAKRKGDALPLDEKLMSWAFEEEDWKGTVQHAERQLAVNPFLKRAHWCRGCAASELGKHAVAARSFGRLLALGPENPAEVRYRMAEALREEKPEEARKALVEALVEAPRFLEAHEMLLELQ